MSSESGGDGVHADLGGRVMNRQLLWKLLGDDHPHQAHDLESRGLAAALAHSDSAEGVRSFAEKRAPVFTGSASDASFMDGWWHK